MPALPTARSGQPSGGRQRRDSHGSDSEAPPTPTRESLRNATKGLRDKRLQKVGHAKFDAKDALAQDIAAAIRERTALTLAQANAGPDTSNINAAREEELNRQRGRLEDLRRQFDMLHAELIGKEEVRKMLELTIATDKRAPMLGEPIDVSTSAADAMRAPHAPTTPRGGRSQLSSRGRPSTMQSVATTTDTDLGSPGEGGQSEAGAPGALRAGSSSYSEPLDGPGQLAAVRDRVTIAQAELRDMLYHCEVLAHMEQRTRMANHATEGELEELRHTLNKLAKEQAEIVEIGDDASEAVRIAKRELQAARDAHADQQRAYQDMVEQRSTVVTERKAGKEREKAFEAGEIAAKLDGQGELDAEGEMQLRRDANDAQAARVTSTIAKEAAMQEVSRAEEVYQKLRRATHDPEAISTPQDLLVTMLSMEERGVELQNQVDRTEEAQNQLGLDLSRHQQELNNYLYFGSSSQLLAEAEREFEPSLEAANNLMDTRQKKCNGAKGLVHDAKIGMALLLHLTHGESVDKVRGTATSGTATSGRGQWDGPLTTLSLAFTCPLPPACLGDATSPAPRPRSHLASRSPLSLFSHATSPLLPPFFRLVSSSDCARRRGGGLSRSD